MIQIEQLRKRFGDVTAVDKVSFSAKDRAITGLLGPNGAGKTTTMRAITGMITPDHGDVFIDGIAATNHPQKARQRLGILPDARGLYPRLTARENIRYFGNLYGQKGPSLEERIETLAYSLGFISMIDRPVHGFSQGERMKVALLRAMVHDPQNLVFDEPTNGLDVMSTRAIREVIRNARDQGRCVLLASHIMQEVAMLCDHIVVFARGTVAAQGTPTELRERSGHSNLEDAFVALIGSHEGSGT